MTKDSQFLLYDELVSRGNLWHLLDYIGNLADVQYGTSFTIPVGIITVDRLEWWKASIVKFQFTGYRPRYSDASSNSPNF